LTSWENVENHSMLARRCPGCSRYQLFFQFAGVAEATISAGDWAWLRMFNRGDGDTGQWIADLRGRGVRLRC
jgi:hypothetical protein